MTPVYKIQSDLCQTCMDMAEFDREVFEEFGLTMIEIEVEEIEQGTLRDFLESEYGKTNDFPVPLYVQGTSVIEGGVVRGLFRVLVKENFQFPHVSYGNGMIKSLEKTSLEELLEQAESLFNKDNLEVYFEKLNLPFLYFVGETPYFNDGSACVHTVRRIASTDDMNEWYLSTEEILDNFEVDADVNIEGDIPESLSEEQKKVIDNLIIPILDKTYETNYKVLFLKGVEGHYYTEFLDHN